MSTNPGRPYRRGGFGFGYRGGSRGAVDGWLAAGESAAGGDDSGTGGGFNSLGKMGYNRGTGGSTGKYSRGMVNNRGTGGKQRRPKALGLDTRAPLTAEHFPKGPVLAELTSADLVASVSNVQREEEEGTGKKFTKEDYELLASYNWLPKEMGAQVAAMVVPGLAARWAPPKLPAWLHPDSGIYYVDQNAHWCPGVPLEPAFRAVFDLHPTFDPNDIDIVTDRNNLRKLFRFACGNKELIHDFKFFIEVINKTVLITRWEPKATGTVVDGEFRGFGHAFEKEFTKYTKGLELSTGHHRICRYKFSGLNVLCRFSADAFLGSKKGPIAAGEESQEVVEMVASVPPVVIPGKKAPRVAWRPKQTHLNLLDDPLPGDESEGQAGDAQNHTQKSLASPIYIPPRQLTNPDDLADILSNVSLQAPESPKRFPAPTPTETPLELISGGVLMPQHRVLEIKTRSANCPIDLTDQIPQLWFSATCNLYVGYHQRGMFTRVDTEVMDAFSLEKWERENQDDLLKMGSLLNRIVEIARGVAGGRAQVACIKGELKIYGIAKEEVVLGTLPAEIRKRWESR